MNNLKNKVQLIGHLGGDPEVKKFDSGKVRATFRLATNENYKNGNGEWIQETQWHTIIAWNGLAQRAEKKLKKGNEVAVSGKLTYRSYEDKNGTTRQVTEINADNLEVFGGVKDNKQEAVSGKQ
ncbi:MAG: single-stranded DNA-binding protein [Cyclobacteriaceae bacterium]|nr:single-stranded DNA-binding protein [Cyclobacteriaceae bacterium]